MQLSDLDTSFYFDLGIDLLGRMIATVGDGIKGHHTFFRYIS